MSSQIRLPEEYKSLLSSKKDLSSVGSILSVKKHLHTVCTEAKCPNIGKCFKSGTATFLIMGSKCTRNCAFCAIDKNPKSPIDADESDEVIDAIKKMNLKYVVITSVTRDDIEDGGAEYFNLLSSRIKSEFPGIMVEILVPDFRQNIDNLRKINKNNIDVFNHNLETVKELYPMVRQKADYDFSLSMLKKAKSMGMTVKTGIMVGLGETEKEIAKLFDDISKAGAEILTIGQYFMPTKNHYQVRKYYLSKEFDALKERAERAGIKNVVSGVFVRSSYNAYETYKGVKNDEQT